MSEPAFGLYFRRYAPFSSFGRFEAGRTGFDFEGDYRTTGSTSLSDPNATSRTYGFVIFNQFDIINKFSGTSGSHFRSWGSGGNTNFGDYTAHAKVSMTVVRDRLTGPGLIQFTAHTAGANPFIPGSPNIDTFVKARFSFGSKSLDVTGETFGDNFPNLEVFLHCYHNKRSALLLDGHTTGDRDSGPATRLIGAHSDQSLGKINANLALDDKRELASDYHVEPTWLNGSGLWKEPKPEH
jgi:hypothetical protein